MKGRVLVNTVKNNGMTKGTQGMMDSERLHAQEAIESGIYVNWSKISQGEKVLIALELDLILCVFVDMGSHIMIKF